MFKKGDKVRRTEASITNGMNVGQVYVVAQDQVGFSSLKIEGFAAGFDPDYFDLVEEKFDVTKHPWYIRVNSPEESKAAQDWLFSQGCSWGVGEKEYRHTGEKSITNDNGGARLFWGSQASVESKQEKGVPEIKLTFKTQIVVDKVVLPVVESPQQKQIRELEETIQKATQQIEQLKKGL